MKDSFYILNRHKINEAQLEAVKKLFLPIGHIVLQWSYVDSNLELCLKIIQEYHDTKNIISNKSKSKLTGRKIDLIEECLKKLPSLIPFKKDGLVIMEKALNISKKRNIIIHGTYAGFNTHDGTYNFNKLVYNKQKKQHFIEQYSYTLSKIADLGKTILELATDIAHLGLQFHPNKDML